MKRFQVQGSMLRMTARTSTALLLLYGVSSATAVMAQAARESEKDGLSEVVVTGSRIQRKDTYTAVNATNTVTAEEMRAVGATTAAEMITQMSNNIGTMTPETISDSPTGMSGTIANLRGMNTASGTRTLTLVDGKRYVPTNDGGSVDMSVIPSALVGRMDTVTGGASASYGSDAIAGVVNVVLDKEFSGARVDASWGQTSESDGEKWKGSFVVGTGLLEDKAHVTFSYEHTYQASINDCDTRDYCLASRALYTNGTAPAGFPYQDRTRGGTVALPFPGQPHYLVGDGFRFGGTGVGQVFVNRPGSITTRPWVNPADYALDPGGNWEFNEAGTALVPIYTNLTAAQRQSVADNSAFGTPTQFGTGPTAYHNVPLLSGSERDSGMAYFSYLFDNDIKTSATVSLAKTSSNVRQNSTRQMMLTSNVWSDNPYLATLSAQDQAILRSRMSNCAAFGFSQARPYSSNPTVLPGTTAPCIGLTKDWSYQLPRLNGNDAKVMNISLDALGPIGENWSWKAYVNYGKTDRTQTIADWATVSRWEMANDTVSEGGLIKCRVLAAGAAGVASRALWAGYYKEALGEGATDAEAARYVNTLSNGCTPVNPFGYAASDAALAYSWPDYPMLTTQTMVSGTASASGELWQGWGAGPFQLASGVDYDSNKSESVIDADPILATDVIVNNGGQWSGRTTNIAPFIEVEVPLLADLPGARSLLLNGAYRYTHNKTERLGTEPESSSRNIPSWKLSTVWQPLNAVRLRGTYSSDVRAPAARELYRESASAVGASFFSTSSVQNPWVDRDDPDTPENEKTDRVLSNNGGNTNLKSEKSITKTLGLVFTPSGFLQGTSASVDYYRTTIKGGISNVTVANVLSGCFQHLNLGIDNNFCDNIRFGTPIIAGNPYSNIEEISSSTANAENFSFAGIDYSLSYFKPMGSSSLNLRLMATQFLEQDVFINAILGRRDVAGQTGSSGVSSFFGCTTCNYTPTPTWQGNFTATYAIKGLASTLQVRYIGKGRLSNQDQWIGPGETGHYTNTLTNTEVEVPYNSNLSGTINEPNLPAWTVFNLNFNYSFADSPWATRLGGLELTARVLNVTNKLPTRFSGRNAGGVNAIYYSGLGRQYEVAMRYKF